MEREPKPADNLEMVSPELEAEARERLANLEQGPETVQAPGERLDSARRQIERQPEQDSTESERAHQPKPHPTKFDKAAAYHQTLASLQRRLKPASRTFSKVIHAPAVEKSSEIVGKTILRPSVSLGATLTALVVGGFFYWSAKHYGFALSGSEFIIALLAGGVIGLIVEGVLKLVRRHH